MPRSRLPKLKAEITGAAAHDPQRFRNRKIPKPRRPIGEPYAGMSEAERVIWAECAAEMPWLHSAHRLALRAVCGLSVRAGAPDAPHTVFAALLVGLGRIGATPTEESKIAVLYDDTPDDPTDKFFAAH